MTSSTCVHVKSQVLLENFTGNIMIHMYVLLSLYKIIYLSKLISQDNIYFKFHICPKIKELLQIEFPQEKKLKKKTFAIYMVFIFSYL